MLRKAQVPCPERRSCILAPAGGSGAPLWYEDGENFKLVSIHYGREGNNKLMRNSNWGIKIPQDVLNWIINIEENYQ